MSDVSTDTASTQAAREKLPPLEMDMAENAVPVKAHTAAIAMAPPVAEPAKESEKNTEITPPEQGNWFHRNRWFTKEPVTYAGYQFFRSFMATIPYGFGMAGVHHGFGVLNKKGMGLGLTEKGQEVYWDAFKKVDEASKMAGGAPAGLKAIDFVKELHPEKYAELLKPGLMGSIGRNMMRVASSPLNPALQIGLAFSMFRFTGGLIKGQRDKVMDEKNTAEDTNRETKNWWKNTKQLASINWKPEATGTFWGGLTLGFIGAVVQQTMPYKRLPHPTTGQLETFGQAFKRVWSKPSKLLQNGAIWGISYSTFFEVDERIQKDWKLRHGDWKGHANSLTNKPDNDAGVPPVKDADGKISSEQPAEAKHHFFTQDPGLPRLVFRRVLPVAVGITGYAVMKRAGYVLGGGQMAPITNEITTAAQHSKRFFGNAWREGLATGTFGILWMATDAWGTWYDKMFHDKNAETKPPTEHQEKKYEELLARVNAKEKEQGRAA